MNFLFTTKNDGNLALHVGDKDEAKRNRAALLQKLGVRKLVFMEQIHGNEVREFFEKELQNSQNNIVEVGKCDAVFTSEKGVGLCVMVADCAPVLVFDRVQKKVAAVHAGRAGVLSCVFSETLNAMQSEPKNVHVVVGPHICEACYEVGELECGEFNKFKIGRNFSIKRALKSEFETLGVKCVEFVEACTKDALYYSHRQRDAARFCGVVWL